MYHAGQGMFTFNESFSEIELIDKHDRMHNRQRFTRLYDDAIIGKGRKSAGALSDAKVI